MYNRGTDRFFLSQIFASILETGQLIGDHIPNTTPLQKKSRMAKEKLFDRGLFIPPKNLVKVLECTDIRDPREQQTEIV